MSAWERWFAVAGPWQGWSVCPLLALPSNTKRAPAPEPRAPAVEPHSQAIAAQLISQLADAPSTLLLLDLPPDLGVRIAAALYRADLAHPVLLIARWPYAAAVLETDALRMLLEAEARTFPAPRARLRHVSFVLDAERASPTRRPTNDPRADNRYVVSPNDLPNLAVLRARGIHSSLKLSHACAR